MTATDEILAIPLWINGHAYLTMAPAFLDVCDPRNGQVRRRTPLCGELEARAAVEAARAALAAWSAQTVGQRAALLAALGDALAEYGGHFAALIAEETGQQVEVAAVEVGNAVSLLRAAGGYRGKRWRQRRRDRQRPAPLLGPLQRAVPVLLAGASGAQTEPEGAFCRLCPGRTNGAQRLSGRRFQYPARRPTGHRSPVCLEGGEPAARCRRAGL
ncbi:MAG: aldehyde dehydrogenase family protein [Candidatus Accumulibacter sp.]|nr:aldehyde dehydrogenase family protein [Accumulibacter sp.]